ncbi:hypothetical protein HanPSC8_Chr16g0710011 [Helianthus annuus]|nr:hypothetical protein HanIR_Chr16g0805071 [Helianthus annuus]KAJ0820606.1 hypothetical protein HanPSC8_Chr16g0710011 [Helianthus annuus]
MKIDVKIQILRCENSKIYPYTNHPQIKCEIETSIIGICMHIHPYTRARVLVDNKSRKRK